MLPRAAAVAAGLLMDQADKAGRRILFEGAQGALLDVDQHPATDTRPLSQLVQGPTAAAAASTDALADQGVFAIQGNNRTRLNGRIPVKPAPWLVTTVLQVRGV